MYRCPNCGSSEQIKEIGCYNDSKKLVEKFLCGCGCRFNKNNYWCGNAIYLIDIEIVNTEENS